MQSGFVTGSDGVAPASHLPINRHFRDGVCNRKVSCTGDGTILDAGRIVLVVVIPIFVHRGSVPGAVRGPQAPVPLIPTPSDGGAPSTGPTLGPTFLALNSLVSVLVH